MPLYFGYPVTCQEAFRLFSLDFEQAKGDIMQKHKLTENMYMDCHFVDYANNFLIGKNVAMRVFYTDKGQCIVGYKIEKLSVFEKKFVNVSELTNMLEELGVDFWYEITIINYEGDLNKITLEHMEDEPESVDAGQPYIIEFNH